MYFGVTYELGILTVCVQEPNVIILYVIGVIGRHLLEFHLDKLPYLKILVMKHIWSVLL